MSLNKIFIWKNQNWIEKWKKHYFCWIKNRNKIIKQSKILYMIYLIIILLKMLFYQWQIMIYNCTNNPAKINKSKKIDGILKIQNWRINHTHT